MTCLSHWEELVTSAEHKMRDVEHICENSDIKRYQVIWSKSLPTRNARMRCSVAEAMHSQTINRRRLIHTSIFLIFLKNLFKSETTDPQLR